VDEILQRARARHGLPALGAAVFGVNQAPEVAVVGVRRQGFPVNVVNDDRWHLGSNTKAFTAMVVARLVERGRLRWDSTVGQVLGGALPVHDAFQGVTLEDLLSHAGGLPHDFPMNPAWKAAVARQGSLHQQRLDLVGPLLASQPVYPPGTQHSYSNVGFVVAGVMAETAAGQAWEELVLSEIVGPLGLSTAGFGAPGRTEFLDQPWGHRRRLFWLAAVPPGPRADNPPALGPEGTLHMSLADYITFLSDQVAGAHGDGRLLSREGYHRLHNDEGRLSWGLGWGVRHMPSWGTVITHTGSNGFWYHVAWASLDRRVGFAIASNGPNTQPTEAACDEVREGILKLLRERAGSEM
jgi:CubicO group peptidase (beta-lactamase class C family)